MWIVHYRRDSSDADTIVQAQEAPFTIVLAFLTVGAEARAEAAIDHEKRWPLENGSVTVILSRTAKRPVPSTG